jgi:predicted NACHT family NTPase
MLVEAKAFQLLEMFIQEDLFREEDPFWCGLYVLLEKAWITGDLPIKDRVVQLIQQTIPRLGQKHQRTQELIRLIADNLGQPRWKDIFPNNKHKLRVWKNRKYEPKLLKGYHSEAADPKGLPTSLLQEAWIGCLEARKFYADARISDYYLQRERLKIKRISGELLDMGQCYINLSVIEHSREGITVQLDDTEKKRQPSAFTLFSRMKVEAAETVKNVLLPDLFNDRTQLDGTMARPKRILIRGRAGVGKTTLCKKIVYDFLHNQMWARFFDRVLWIPLRNLKGKSGLDQLLREEYFSTMHLDSDCLVPALLQSICDQTYGRTLLLLDGLDEISREPNVTEAFTDLLNRHDVIITSRPYAVHLPCLGPFDLELETIGFYPNQVQAYRTITVKP